VDEMDEIEKQYIFFFFLYIFNLTFHFFGPFRFIHGGWMKLCMIG